MASFAAFAQEAVERQVAYYQQCQGEYNKDPFSLRYREQITVHRVFGLPSGTNQEKNASMGNCLKLGGLAVEYENALAAEETQLRKLFREHRDALMNKERELAELQKTEDPVLTALSKDHVTRTALVEYRRYGFDRLRYVTGYGVLAVVDAETSSTWFFPRHLPKPPAQLDSSLFCVGDAIGLVSRAAEAARRCRLPADMHIEKEKVPFWFTHLCDFHPRKLICHAAWMNSYRDRSTLPDPGRELVYAMVATRQVVSYFGRGEGSYPDSYAALLRLHDAFYRYAKLQLVDPALEVLHRKFRVPSWSSLCSTVVPHLPVFLPFDGLHQNEEGVCPFTGKTTDLVRLAIVRCAVLEWNHEGRFEEHVASFDTKYRDGQQRWWNAVGQPSIDAHYAQLSRGGSPYSSTPPESCLPHVENSRMRGRTTSSRGDWSKSTDDDDFDGFLVSPWKDSLLVHKNVVFLLRQVWRLCNLDWWLDYTFLEWKTGKAVLASTNKDLIDTTTDLIVSALQQCPTMTELQ